MESVKYTAIGLMSGTSLDGLDICAVEFTKESSWSYKILNAVTIPYDHLWKNQLANAILLSAADLYELNTSYGFYLGEKIREFIQDFQIDNVDLIASHGHTVFHQPKNGFTTQIGDGRAIKIINNVPVAYDFRTQDVLLKGNGAPLVPIGDEFLFSDYDACINLGGFSNISFKLDNQRVAFDIGPLNVVLNNLAQRTGKEYDEDGNLAAEGNIDEFLLEKLNNLEYFNKPFPKSLGIEWVNETVFPLLNGKNTINNIATFTAHAAEQIAEVINQYDLKNALLTGGGAYNSTLINNIKKRTSAEIVIPDSTIINFKEALIFAFMGVLRLRNENNVLSSATGSLRDHCSGLLL